MTESRLGIQVTLSSTKAMAVQEISVLTTAESSRTRRSSHSEPSRRLRGLLALGVFLAVGITGFFIFSRAWEETKRRQASLPQLESMAVKSPHDGRLLALLGGRLAEAREYPAAAETLQRAVASGDGEPSVWLTWAASVAAQGDIQGAGAVLRLGLRDDRAAPVVRGALDRAAILSPRTSPAVLAQTLCPQGTEPLIASHTRGSFLNALAEWRDRRYPEQSSYVSRQKWAAQRPEDAQAMRLWGEALMQNRRYAEAETALRRAVELAPASPKAHLALGNLLFDRGVVAKGGLEYEACLRLRPRWLPALIGLGKVCLSQGLNSIALPVFRLATETAPKSTDAWIGLGRAYYTTRMNITQSLAAFETAHRLSPQRTDFFADYANALRWNYRRDEAEQILRQRLRADPNDAHCRYLLGWQLLDHNASPAREAEAESQLRESLRLVPHTVATELKLAQLLEQKNRNDEALALLQDAAQEEPRNSKVLYALGRALQRTGAGPRAEQMLRLANDLANTAEKISLAEDEEHLKPSDPKAHEKLARLYAQAGREAEARRETDFAFLLRTHPRDAAHGIQQLDKASSAMMPGDR